MNIQGDASNPVQSLAMDVHIFARIHYTCKPSGEVVKWLVVSVSTVTRTVQVTCVKMSSREDYFSFWGDDLEAKNIFSSILSSIMFLLNDLKKLLSLELNIPNLKAQKSP